MKQYKEIVSTDYFIQKLKCRCNTCCFEFYEYIPLNYELVCFTDKFDKKYFLPTYGEYGYLDLLEKLVEDWKPNQKITSTVVKNFEQELKKITLHSVSLFRKIKCSACSKDDVIVLQRESIKNYPVKWMKIDIENI